MNTLHIIQNNQIVDMTINQIFDTLQFSQMIGVTFSTSGSFINKYLADFNYLTIVVGIPEERIQANTNSAITQQNLAKRIQQIVTNDGPELYQQLDPQVKLNINDKKFNLLTPLSYSIHSKFYLLSNDDQSDTRVILGSANLSEQAFNSASSQFEDILIFDHSPLFNLYYQYFKNDLKPVLNNYIPKSLTKLIVNKINQLPKEAEIEQALFVTPAELEQLKPEAYSETGKDIAKQITLGLLPVDITTDMRNVTDDNQQRRITQRNDTNTIELATTLVKKMVSPKANQPHIQPRAKLVNNFKKYIKVKKVANVDDTIFELNQLYYQSNLRNANRHITGMFIENAETKLLMPFGKLASTEAIKHGLTAIQHLLTNYQKFVIGYTTDYGSRVYEAILYAFTAPFLNEIRINSTQNVQEGNDIPQFLFIGGTGGSGKSSLLRIISKMLGIYSTKNYLNYENILPRNVNNIKSQTIQQIRNWIDSDNVAPLLIDEVPSYFFEKQTYGNDLVVQTTNYTSENPHPFPAFIGTTNSDTYTFKDQALRRSYYLKNDRVFDDELRQESTKAYNDVLDEINDALFQDFVVRMNDLLESDDAEFNHYANQGKIDFLYNTRLIFKHYYQLINEPIPSFFPQNRYDDSQESNQARWRKLYLSAKDDFRYNKDSRSLFFRITSVDKNSVNRFGIKASDIYRNALSPKVIIGDKTSIDLELKIPEFFQWIGIKSPYKKRSFFDFLNK